jgi:hypothetical protein
MKTFNEWFLEREEKDFSWYSDAVLGKLGLDQEGLDQPINAFNQDELINKIQELGIFANLPDEIKSNVLSQIDNSFVTGQGSIRDLVTIMANA